MFLALVYAFTLAINGPTLRGFLTLKEKNFLISSWASGLKHRYCEVGK